MHKRVQIHIIADAHTRGQAKLAAFRRRFSYKRKFTSPKKTGITTASANLGVIVSGG
jgi:hypothetical protein